MDYPELEVKATHYYPDFPATSCASDLSDLERHTMKTVLDQAELALKEGNPPIGAAIIDNDDFIWTGKTSDKTSRHLMHHAEMRVYEKAQPSLGDDLSTSTLVTNAQLCTTCSSYYASGKIGRVIIGANRDMIRSLAGIMRDRECTMPKMFKDGHTDTVVVENVMAIESLKLFAEYGKLRNYQPAEDTPGFLQEIFDSV